MKNISIKTTFSFVVSCLCAGAIHAAELYSLNHGNFFQPNEALEFHLELDDREHAQNRVVRLDLCDFENRIIATKSIKLSSETKFEVSFPSQEHEGFYQMKAFIDEAPLTACTLGVMAAAELGKKADYESRFGVVAHLKHMSNNGRDAMLDLVQRAGFGWIREGFLWDELEPEQDVWNTERYDDLIDRSFAHGLCVLPVLCFGNSWASIDQSLPKNQARLAQPHESAWKNYLEEMVKRYGDRVHAWEIWNEPNLQTFWYPQPDADAYAVLAKQAADTLRAIAPEDTLISAGFSPCEGYLPDSPEQFEVEFVSRLAQQEVLPFDALGQHPYTVFHHGVSHAETEKLFLDNLRNVGKGLAGAVDDWESYPIWLTEMGVSTIPRITNERDAAGYLTVVLAIATAQTNTPRIIIYNFRDVGADPTEKEHMFGLLNLDNTPKPGYFAVRTFIQKVGGNADFVERLETGGVVSYSFKSHEGTRIDIVWAADASVEMAVPAEAKQVVNAVDEPALVWLQDGAAYVEVSASPIYIEY